jgi:ubiquinone/menaquinone biosynthesis C-methylase UbiE
LELAKKVYDKGGNITQHLRSQHNIGYNNTAIIEAAYDLQAGSYIDYANKNISKVDNYTSELSLIINDYLSTGDNILDVGCGELTTLSFILNKLNKNIGKIFAFDISWSRLFVGLKFSRKVLADKSIQINPFVSDMHHIPLMDNSIAITTSSHALEPNGESLPRILAELFRVTSKYLILFEPYYEMNSKEGKKRMDKHGYIKGLPNEIKKLGGELEKKIKIRSKTNPLNPTYGFIIKPPNNKNIIKKSSPEDIYSIPGTNQKIINIGDAYFSNKSGIAFPIFKKIPILRKDSFILASALMDEL